MEIIQITGYIGRDLALTVTNGVTNAYFSVAVDKSYKTQDGQKVSATNWYTIWKKPSGVDKYLKKGTMGMIQGIPRMKIDSYEGKQSIKLSIQNPMMIELLSSSAENQGESTAPPPVVSTAPAPSSAMLPSFSEDDQDLPF